MVAKEEVLAPKGALVTPSQAKLMRERAKKSERGRNIEGESDGEGGRERERREREREMLQPRRKYWRQKG